ncbi:hypothetical protein PRZ48_011162 [Zasmidium cellare]|uniref:Uncharacterized protein n=1 Tax=Zasmidium cellare TaxID=395010 RepID=A0ABR0EAL4_ZASCE|nr:hypothetical protein PRZ48_011162 [Zasmidium cellare]
MAATQHVLRLMSVDDRTEPWHHAIHVLRLKGKGNGLQATTFPPDPEIDTMPEDPLVNALRLGDSQSIAIDQDQMQTAGDEHLRLILSQLPVTSI